MGGTSFDVGLVVKDSVRSYDFRPIIDRWMVGITMIKTLSIGAGGGSIAYINKLLQNRVQVGPAQRRLDARPGMLQPRRNGADGHRRRRGARLHQSRLLFRRQDAASTRIARSHAIRDKIAKPLGVGVEEGAAIIRKIVNGNMSSAIMKEVHLRGYSPEEFILFVGGGAGATHAEGFKGDIRKAVMFPFSPVFCAFGSSTMDIMHVYEASKKLTLMTPGTQQLTNEFAVYNQAVESLVEQARKDLVADGLDPAKAAYVLELDMLYGGQFHVKRASRRCSRIHSAEDVRAICDAFNKEFSEAFSPFVVNPEGGIFIESFILKAIVTTPKVDLPKSPLEDKRSFIGAKRRAPGVLAGSKKLTEPRRFSRTKP